MHLKLVRKLAFTVLLFAQYSKEKHLANMCKMGGERKKWKLYIYIYVCTEKNKTPYSQLNVLSLVQNVK